MAEVAYEYHFVCGCHYAASCDGIWAGAPGPFDSFVGYGHAELTYFVDGGSVVGDFSVLAFARFGFRAVGIGSGVATGLWSSSPASSFCGVAALL